MNLNTIQDINSGNASIGKRDELDSFLKDMQDQKMFSIKEAVDDIGSYILKRAEVNKNIVEHVEKVKLMISNFIMELNIKEPDAKLLLELRKKMIEMEEILIEEKLNYFRDCAELKHELRETMREYREKESNANAIDNFFKK